MSRHMMLRTTIRLPQLVQTAAKKRTTNNGRTLTKLIIAGLRQQIDLPIPKSRIQMLRVCGMSKRSEHQFPCIDFKLIEEEDDFDRLKKLGMLRNDG